MDESTLKVLLGSLLAGDIDLNQAVARLKNTVFQTTDLGHAQPDHHRVLRHGLNEVIYGEGKSSTQIIEIAGHLAAQQQCVLITRLNTKKLTRLQEAFPEGKANQIAKTFMIHAPAIVPFNTEKKFVAIVSAGTSDMFVAEEAVDVCIAMRIAHHRCYDIGVSGLHRLGKSMNILQKASVIIVVAGMEGALPSVVGGLVGAPIIAVPTSIGYGASFQGVAALLGMLNSCASGVTVTNIDAGFSAGFAAARIINRMNHDENTVS